MNVTTPDLPRLGSDHIGRHGWLQNRMEDEQGRVCLSGAIRACSPSETDSAVTMAVLRASGHGEEWNDDPARTADEVREFLSTTTVTDEVQVVAFGPQRRHIVDILRRAETLTAAQVDAMTRTMSGDAPLARHLADQSLSALCRDGVQYVETPPSGALLDGPVGDAVRAIALRDVTTTGRTEFTGDDYRVLTAPWADIVGPAHPDDDPSASVGGAL